MAAENASTTMLRPSLAQIWTLVLTLSCCMAWETKQQALLQAFQLVNDPRVFGVASLSTKFPSGHQVSELAGHIITGPEYFAPCYPKSGDLLFLGLTVSQTWRNIINSEGKNATVSIASNADPSVPDRRHLDRHDSHDWDPKRPSWRRCMPSKSRATLFGHFELTNATKRAEKKDKLADCYLSYHPEASHWAPNATESPHVPFWATFVVDRVYWVGGFGDEHYIGWFNQSEWQGIWQRHGRDHKHDSFAVSESEGDIGSEPNTFLEHTTLFGESDAAKRRPKPPQLTFQY